MDKYLQELTRINDALIALAKSPVMSAAHYHEVLSLQSLVRAEITEIERRRVDTDRACRSEAKYRVSSREAAIRAKSSV
jgi:hypothetical protein